jgi:hypothetical protein
MGRNATILFDDNSVSKLIKLGTGFTQGNGPSPLQFNFCQQILIFKLEFGMIIFDIPWNHLKLNTFNAQIHLQPPLAPNNLPALQSPAPAPVPAPVPVLAPGPDPELEEARVAAQNQRQLKGKVEGFADDTNAMGEAKRESLHGIKLFLTDFARVSGLKVNFDKCILMVVGTGGTVPDYFYETGFRVDNKATILGMTIYTDLTLLTENFNVTIEQLLHLRNYWSQFNLSLPGRLAIAKTLMLSRLGYLGSIISPTEMQIKNIVYGFVKGKLNVSQQRITVPVDLGGLGMFNLDHYLIALKCTWVKRASLKQSNLWSYCLNEIGVPDPDNKPRIELNGDLFPVLNPLTDAAEIFYTATLKCDNNILESKINNPRIFGEPNLGNRFQNLSFNNVRDEGDRYIIQNLKFKYIIDIGNLAELSQKIGFAITPDTYSALTAAVKFLKTNKFLTETRVTQVFRNNKLSS